MNKQLLLPENDSALRKANLFFRWFLIFGLILIFLCPPFIVPDEQAHFTNILRISRGHIGADVCNGQIGSFISTEELDFFNRYSGLYHGPGSIRFSYEQMSEMLSREASGELAFLPITYSTINPFAYILPSVALAIFRLLTFFSANAYMEMMFVKFFHTVLGASLIRLAILKTKAFTDTMFVLALMPMTVFLVTSTSYDAILIPAGFLLFAYFTRLFSLKEGERLQKQDIVAILGGLAVFCAVKIVYAVAVIILLSVPVKRFGSRKNYFLCIGAAAGVFVLFYLAPIMINNIRVGEYLAEPTAEKLLQNAYVKEHLLSLPKVVFASVRHFDGYWAESFFGILGWLDIRFPTFFAVLFFLLLFGTLLLDVFTVKTFRGTWMLRLTSFVAFTVICCGIIFAMYFDENPRVGIVGGDIAYGVQGRYFIPAFLFFPLTFVNSFGCRIEEQKCLVAFRERVIPSASFIYLILTALLILVKCW